MSSPSRICPSNNCPKPAPGTSLIYKDSTITNPLKLSYQRGYATFALWMKVDYYNQMFGGFALQCTQNSQEEIEYPGDDEPINPVHLVPGCRDLIKRIQAVVATADASAGKIRTIYASNVNLSPIIGISSVSEDVKLIMSDWRAEHYPDICAWCGAAKTVVQMKEKTENSCKSLEDLAQSHKELEDLAQSHKELEDDVIRLRSEKLHAKVKANGESIKSLIRLNEEIYKANLIIASAAEELKVLHAEAIRPMTGSPEFETTTAIICIAQIKIVNAKLTANQARLIKLLEEMKVAQATFNESTNLQFLSDDEDSDDEKSPPCEADITNAPLALRRASPQLAAEPLVTVEDELAE
jgi:hypothetical protein